MRVAGIDPGTGRTGYGVVEMEGNRLRHVAHGVIVTRAADGLPARLDRIFEGLLAVFEAHEPEEVGVEGIFHARNARSALTLGHARGAALLAAHRAGIPVVEYSPMQVKQAVVGYGGAEKHQVQEMVRRLLGLGRPAPADASDALAVAICHLQTARTRRALGTAR
ncbi:MAG: crossover junction endodeoxyribonuclease RuvC [Candidatus Dadabacteria bacterium]|nr:MAG: crossover junction endodeoxyribonuclease RuvC [Candidatus Dadabacteria bacterium]